MYVLINDPTDAPQLVDIDNFRAFHLVVSSALNEEALDGYLRRHSIGHASDGHGFIRETALPELAGSHADDAWRTQLGDMVRYAQGKGWWDASTASLRAHIEALPDA